MENINFEINGIPITISDQSEVIQNIRNDNEFAKKYVEEMWKNSLLKDCGIDKLRTIYILEEKPHNSVLSSLEDYDVAGGFPDNHNTLDEELEQQPACYDFNNTNDGNLIWTTKGKPSQRDLEAVEYFLTLRGSDKYRELFNDKKHSHNQIYRELGMEMLSKGYNLGNGKTAAEKLRQKFKNLTKSYITFINHVKYTTGGEYKSPPPFYDLLHVILGGKHKIQPELILNSESDVDLTIPNNNESEVLEGATNKENLAVPQTDTNKSLKTNRPKTKNEEILEKLTLIHGSSEKQFDKMHNLLKEQNEILKTQNHQRDRMIDIFENIVNKHHKRRRYSSDSS